LYDKVENYYNNHSFQGSVSMLEEFGPSLYLSNGPDVSFLASLIHGIGFLAGMTIGAALIRLGRHAVTSELSFGAVPATSGSVARRSTANWTNWASTRASID
jgi:hypothetical protein